MFLALFLAFLYNWVLMNLARLSQEVQYWFIRKYDTEFIYEWMAWWNVKFDGFNTRSEYRMGEEI